MADDRIPIFVDYGGPSPEYDPKTHVLVNYVEPDEPQDAHSVDSEPVAAPSVPIAISSDQGQQSPVQPLGAVELAREVLSHLNDWATMDPAAAPFPWIAEETAAALRALEEALHACPDCAAVVERQREELAENQKLRRACELIIAVKHCMMFQRIHGDWLVQEVLDKYGAPNVQLLAKMAQDEAEAVLKRGEK